MQSPNPHGLEASGAPGQGGPSLGLELERGHRRRCHGPRPRSELCFWHPCAAAPP